MLCSNSNSPAIKCRKGQHNVFVSLYSFGNRLLLRQVTLTCASLVHALCGRSCTILNHARKSVRGVTSRNVGDAMERRRTRRPSHVGPVCVQYPSYNTSNSPSPHRLPSRRDCIQPAVSPVLLLHTEARQCSPPAPDPYDAHAPPRTPERHRLT
jgi:hypothetical protein